MSTPRYMSETERILRFQFPDAASQALMDRVFGAPGALCDAPDAATDAATHLVAPSGEQR